MPTTEIVKREASIEEEMRAGINSLAIVEVVDADSYTRASDNLKMISGLKSRWTKYWKPVKDLASQTHKALVGMEADGLRPLESKYEAQRLSGQTWSNEQERIRREKEAEANRIAQKQADDAALATAEALEKSGRKVEAASVIAQVQAPQVVIPKAVPAGGGKMGQVYYSAQVLDIKALIKAVADGVAPIECLEPNMTFLNAQARAFKSTEKLRYPGVGVSER